MSVIALSSSDWVKSVEATVGIADYLSMVCSRDSLRVDDTASIEPQAATATAPRTAPAQHPHLGSPQFSFGLWAARAGVKMKIRPTPVTRPHDDTPDSERMRSAGDRTRAVPERSGGLLAVRFASSRGGVGNTATAGFRLCEFHRVTTSDDTMGRTLGWDFHLSSSATHLAQFISPTDTT
jgi:hypothetical protein